MRGEPSLIRAGDYLDNYAVPLCRVGGWATHNFELTLQMRLTLCERTSASTAHWLCVLDCVRVKGLRCRYALHKVSTGYIE